jgi:hypothetical protein
MGSRIIGRGMIHDMLSTRCLCEAVLGWRSLEQFEIALTVIVR